jgi:hypothetical protein
MAAGIGEAIGLQDKPNLFAAQAAGTLARLSAEESARETARRKAQEKDEADTKKVISDADIYSKNTTWHKMFGPAAQRELRDFANDMINYKVENPNASGKGAYQITRLQELHGRMNRLKQNNDAFKDFEKGVQEGKYYADPNLFKKIYETDFSKKLYRDDNGRVVSGDWGGLKTDERYGAMIDANGDFISNPVKKFDFQNRIGGFMNNSNVWTEKEFKTRSQKGVPGMFEDVSVKEVDPLQRESFVDEMVSNPDAVRAWQIENKDRLDDARKKDPSLNNERNYSQFVQETMAEDVRLKTSGRKEDRVGRHIAPPKPPKPAKESKTLSLDASLDDLMKYMTESEEEIMADPQRVALQDNVDRLAGEVEEAEGKTSFDKDKLAGMKASLEEQQAKLDGMGDVKAETKYNFPVTLKTEGASTVINNNDDVVDLTTGKKLSGVNQFKFIPRLIKLRKAGGKWKPYVYGESVDKIAATDKAGNTISDKTATATFAVPLNKVEGFLNKNGTPTKWVSEAIQKAGGAAKETASEQASDEVQEFVVGGKKYRVPANEVAAFKKDMGL